MHKRKIIYQGLTNSLQKFIPQEYKFDEHGSSIFELLRKSPFYPMGKAGEQIAHKSARKIAKLLGSNCHLVDLGCGMGEVSKIYAEQLLPGSTIYPVDISPAAVYRCTSIFKNIRNLKVGTHTPKDFFDGIDDAVINRKPGEKICAALFGGTIANFSREYALAFLKKVRGKLISGDYFMLVTDMDKPKDILEEAYNDPLFLAASWNLNSLAHVNTVFCPNNKGTKNAMRTPFNLNDFAHKAKYFDNHEAPDNQHIAMYVVAKRDLEIHIPRFGMVILKQGEEIKTYESHRFTDIQIKDIARKTLFTIVRSDESSPDWRLRHTLLEVPTDQIQ